METTELAETLELRRTRFFLKRLNYLRHQMSSGDEAILNGLLNGAKPEFWHAIDSAIDREDGCL